MATMSELQADNENIAQQLQEWQQQRYANGENPMDWVAFKAHLKDLGAPDPGDSAPDEFHRWDESMAGGTPDAKS